MAVVKESPSAKDEDLRTVPEVAEQLKVRQSWVYAQAASGKLPSIKVGKYRRFSPAAIRRYLAQQK